MPRNAKYKDSVFSLLFSDPDLLRELYSALEGITLPPDVPITINTLEDVLYKDRFNDISFEIGDTLVVLIEHQSTINPNMALRLLLYIARIYEKLIGDKNIYASKHIPIPRPEFFVLYNGAAPYPDDEVLRLSDSYEKPEIPGLSEKVALELEIRVININEGRNESMARRCRKLSEYSAFIAKVRALEKEMGDKEAAMKTAITYCREHDILEDFLAEHSTEVMNMLMTEWNWDDALAFRFEEGREEGREITARNALNEGISLDLVQKITGLNMETIKTIQAGLC